MTEKTGYPVSPPLTAPKSFLAHPSSNTLILMVSGHDLAELCSVSAIFRLFPHAPDEKDSAKIGAGWIGGRLFPSPDKSDGPHVDSLTYSQ